MTPSLVRSEFSAFFVSWGRGVYLPEEIGISLSFLSRMFKRGDDQLVDFNLIRYRHKVSDNPDWDAVTFRIGRLL